MPRSVAFKCTYNDGDSGDFVGLRGTCSRDLIAFNVNTHVWCSQKENRCRQYYEKGMHGEKPHFPCMESELFEYWRFNGGTWHNGPRKGRQIPVTDTAVGKVVVLTTRKRDADERERKIIGLYEIGSIDVEGNLVAHPEFRVRLRSHDADRLGFWNYYCNAGDRSLFWGTMLFRYLEDAQVHRILADISGTAGDSSAREIVDRLIKKHFGNTAVPFVSGALKANISPKRLSAIARKYPGGEGQEHRSLKEWIAAHPKAIGLVSNAVPDVEHDFASGDCVDIAFKTPDGSRVVVEIETTQPFPGAHQVIKYRALMAAENGLQLDSPKVKGILVAWDYSSSELAFCKKYDILVFKCRRGEMGLNMSE